MINKSEIYLNKKISPKKLWNFIEKIQETETEIHSFSFYKSNELMAEIAIAPYSYAPMQLYSLSKSFTSTAIGIAERMGLVDLEEKIIDIFPEHLPEVINDNIKNMRVRHVLTMNNGHGGCSMGLVSNSDNPISAFFEKPVEFEPGTHFSYDTGSTYMLSAIIKKRTGMTTLDFLMINLFEPLGITPDRWYKLGETSEGGIGLQLSSKDVAKLGLLYLNKGMWNGERILTEKWCEDAGKPHTDNSGNGTPDWTSGYGYQFWVNSQTGFRGDGAWGQYLMIIPEMDIVFSMFSDNRDMQKCIDIMMDYFRDFEAEGEEFDLAEKLDSLYTPYSSEEKEIKISEKYYRLKPNGQKFTLVFPEFSGDIFSLKLSDGERIQTIKAGNGFWIENRIVAASFKPNLQSIIKKGRTEEATFLASYKIVDGKIELVARFINCVHRKEWTIDFTDGFSLDYNEVFDMIAEDSKKLTSL